MCTETSTHDTKCFFPLASVKRRMGGGGGGGGGGKREREREREREIKQ